jgi:hypothetical protein
MRGPGILRRHITEGEWRNVRAGLPKDLRHGDIQA